MTDNYTYSPELLARACQLGAATLHEASGKRGAMPSRIKPLRSDWRIAAPVYTVAGPVRDNLWLHRAIYAAPAGSVLVHECGDAEAGYWGGIMANAALHRKLAGFVTEGGVRDSEELCQLAFPIFASNICIHGTSKRADGAGSLGSSIIIGNIVVQTGDLLVGDADGVVIIEKEDVDRIVGLGATREQEERDIVERIRNGETTLSIYKLA